MAETTDFVSRIKVRDLISAYESKSKSDKVEFFRPRAKSVGNVLAKNVIVQLSEFNNLDDIEKALRKIDTNLNFYEVYNKAKHVAFQEQLFNILTSIVNIESDEEDAIARRKQLISKTQTLVSFLNQKLPSNVNTVVTSDSSQYKYTPYSSYIKENGTTDTKSNDTSDTVKYKPAPHSGSTKNIEISNWDETPFVSVKKLKEHFLPKNEIVPPPTPKTETTFKSEYNFKVTRPATSNGFKQEQPKVEQPKEEVTSKEQPIQEAEPTETVSVLKLRNLFEKKSEESPKGLEIVSDTKSDLSKSLFGGSASDLNLPYTERNVGNLRLKRSVSGSYMNYTGLLNRIDINRTNSVNELNKVGVQDSGKGLYNVNDNYGDSGDESDTEEDDDKQPKRVDEYKVSYSTPSLGYVGQKTQSTRTQGEDESKLENAKVYEVTYSISTNDETEQEPTHTVQEIIAAIEGAEEVDVKYSTAETKDISKNENAAIVGGVEEVDVNYTTATVDDIKQNFNSTDNESNAEIEEMYVNKSPTDIEDQNNENAKEDSNQDSNNTDKETFVTADETKVNYLTAESKDILDNENTADIQGIEEVDVKYSTTSSGAVIQSANIVNTENVATVDSVEEVDVQYSTAGSESILENEKTASVQSVETSDVSYSNATFDTVNHEVQKVESQEDFRNAPTNGTDGSDDANRKITTIEEEIDKIEVDPTLANEDIILNAEDLKNADDEFEKLLESSEAEKLTT